eukprot:gene5514-3930_t
MSCKVFDNRNRFEEIRRSAAFRSILKSYLNQVHVVKGLRFSMTFQGSPVIVMSDGDLDPEAAAASVSEQQPTAVTSPVHRSTVCQWSVTDVVQSIRKSFAGYDKEVNIVADLVVNGLSARAKQNRPKGVILCGPPGTGKSTLAQSLLEALRCNVKYLDHSLLLRVLEGEAETMLRQCFDDAARIPPCCIVMENMELLLPSRMEALSVTTRAVTQITDVAVRSALRKISPSALREVVVEVPTVYWSDIGGMQEIYVPPPDAESRRSILTIELGKMPTAAIVTTVDDVMDEDMIWLDEIVEISEGYSGAEVVALCSEAALLAVENEETMLSRRHLIQAASKMKPQITAEMLQFYDNFRSKHR